MRTCPSNPDAENVRKSELSIVSERMTVHRSHKDHKYISAPCRTATAMKEKIVQIQRDLGIGRNNKRVRKAEVLKQPLDTSPCQGTC